MERNLFGKLAKWMNGEAKIAMLLEMLIVRPNAMKLRLWPSLIEELGIVGGDNGEMARRAILLVVQLVSQQVHNVPFR
uniref:Uncharacterized protein n=1 Tax=Oryza nivara TaxID=4536 RepID=A0A679BBB1_ORYNI|nr:hypothetical protein [Oryza sativa f. spontanea]